jgi:hypothetical protein
MRLVWGSVIAVMEDYHGFQRLEVAVDGEGAARAYTLPHLTGPAGPGDRVLLNTTAVDLGLGTGGSHVVTAIVPLGQRPEGVALDDPSGGRIMKARYTPVQTDVRTVEEGPEAALLADVDDLGGAAVICCGLHSQVPIAAAAAKFARPDARIAYVMTDHASLPLALSDVVRAARAQRLIDATITTGQAFGGEFEAVNLYSGLLAARAICGADVIIVGIGPGIVGTATAFGHGGVAQGEAINAAAALGGRPVAALRVSFADARTRHQGVSHHTLTALSRVALAPASVAIPVLEAEQAATVEEALETAGVWEFHERAYMEFDLDEALGAIGFEVRTMGRGFAEDPAFFAAAAAAGYVGALIGYHGE